MITEGAARRVHIIQGEYKVLSDPDAFEEAVCRESVAVAVDCSKEKKGVVRRVEKSGGAVVGREGMRELVERAVERVLPRPATGTPRRRLPLAAETVVAVRAERVPQEAGAVAVAVAALGVAAGATAAAAARR